MAAFEAGDVVVDAEGARGTVRYVGPVASAKKKDAVWVGVEWAAEGRGKHDGSVEDKESGERVRYFECADGQGSFVKPQFLRKGVALGDALLDRYQPEGDEDAVADGPDGPRRGNGEAVAIEAVGMDMIRRKQQISRLREVSLASCAVVSAGEPGWIRENCPGLRELDLSDNLVESWATVGTVLSQLPELEHINLARNALVTGLPTSRLVPLPPSMKQRFSTLRVMVLNKTGTHFSQIQRLDTEGVLPALEELVLGDNNLETLDPLADIKQDDSHAKGSYAEWAKEQIREVDRSGFTPESFAQGFRSLRMIDISRNRLGNWSEVWRLSRLPELRHINASDNPIESLFFDFNAAGPEASPGAAPESAPAAPESGDRDKLEKQRREAAAEFERRLGTEGPPPVAEPQPHEEVVAEVERTQATAGVEVVLSNGTVVPVMERKTRARYTQARLFKGDGTGGGAQPFAVLETLLLCRTRIAEWASVDALNAFPSLEELRLQGSPVIATAANPGAARQNVISRVRRLVRLNGSDVSARERSDAERLYLKRIALQLAAKDADASTRDALLAANPRFKELVAEHGDPMESAKAASREQGGSLASNSAKVTIRSFDPRSCTIPPVVKRLPLTMSVKDLKVLCHKLFKVDPDLQKLFYREKGKNFGHPVALDEDIMPIVDYGVKADGEIIMEARDPEKEREDQAKRDEQDAKRLKEQEHRANLASSIKRQEVAQSKASLGV